MTQHGPQLGILGSDLRLGVNAFGTMIPSHRRWTIGLVVGTEDRWRDPHEEPSTRQRFMSGALIVETALSVPGGAVRWRVAVAAGPVGLVEIHNDSPAATAVAFVIRSDWALNASHTEVSVGGDVVMKFPRPMTFGAAGRGERSALDIAMRGAAERKGSWVTAGPNAEMVVLLPLGHGASVTVEVVLESDDPIRPTRYNLTQIAQGWEQQLTRGARIVLPDPVMNSATQVARGLVVLAGAHNPSGATIAALEDWGFDREAELAWQSARFGQRRVARSRAHPAEGRDAWDHLVALWSSMRGAAFLGRNAGHAPDWMSAVRDLVVLDRGRGHVELLRLLPAEWAGAPLEVYDLPVRGGSISYALRWHGMRPALLWESRGVRKITIPAVDPTFETTEARGEILLQAPETAVPMTELGASFS